MDIENPVGLFDSGVGGISVLGAVRHLLPHENIVYYGDTLHAPYGTKSTEEVLKYVHGVMDFMTEKRAKAVVIACNTATAVAAETLRREYSIPIIGMEPALKPASQVRKNGKIIVMATPVTLALPKFHHLQEKYGEGSVSLPCPGLMELVEARDFSSAGEYIKNILSPFDMNDVDAIVLGCTHYVFLRDIIADMLPSHVDIEDGNLGTARQLKRILEQKSELNENGGTLEMFTSGNSDTALPVMEELLKLADAMYAKA